jgi:DNA-binding transcriptional LysR family regulator
VTVTIRQLRDFTALARAGSFTQASLELHVAQPALSYQIKRLEQELGVLLFDRQPRGVSLTTEGRELLERTNVTLHAYDALLETARRLRPDAAGVLRVGFMAQGPGELLPAILRSFKRSHPGVEVTLHQFGFDDCFMGVTRGTTDVGFASGPIDESDEVTFLTLFEEPIVVAMAADHPLADRERLRIEDVVREPLFTDTHPPGRWTDFWNAVEHRGGREPLIAGRFSTHDEWLEAIRLGGGIGLCPGSTARFYPRPGLVFVDLDGMAPAAHGIVCRAGTRDKLVKDFVLTASALAEPGATAAATTPARSSG